MNLKNKASLLKKKISYTRNKALFGGSTLKYWWHYFSNRHFSEDQQYYVVYTNLDNSIPFQANSAFDYWLINFRLSPIIKKLSDAVSGETLNDIRQAYVDIAREGCAAFREVPTIMPAFAQDGGHSLHLTHSLLKPINCSPSLHTVTPFFAYNLALEYYPEKESEFRHQIGEVISTVIKEKKHAMIDIAFGIFLAKRTVQGKLGLDFYDLESFFTDEQKKRNGIPYDRIYSIYHELK